MNIKPNALGDIQKRSAHPQDARVRFVSADQPQPLFLLCPLRRRWRWRCWRCWRSGWRCWRSGWRRCDCLRRRWRCSARRRWRSRGRGGTRGWRGISALRGWRRRLRPGRLRGRFGFGDPAVQVGYLLACGSKLLVGQLSVQVEVIDLLPEGRQLLRLLPLELHVLRLGLGLFRGARYRILDLVKESHVAPPLNNVFLFQ